MSENHKNNDMKTLIKIALVVIAFFVLAGLVSSCKSDDVPQPFQYPAEGYWPVVKAIPAVTIIGLDIYYAKDTTERDTVTHRVSTVWGVQELPLPATWTTDSLECRDDSNFLIYEWEMRHDSLWLNFGSFQIWLLQ